MKLGLIMLSAGNSRRFGSNKLFYPVDGMPMYRRTLELLSAVKEYFQEAGFSGKTADGALGKEGMREGISCGITVVTQYGRIEQEAAKLGARVLWNPHPEEGISSSLKIGLQANEEADACLFTVADQPWLRPDTVISLILKFVSSAKGLACVSAEGKMGNPCIFSKSYYPELYALEGDVGGRRVINRHPEETAVLDVENEKELSDIDVREKILH